MFEQLFVRQENCIAPTRGPKQCIVEIAGLIRDSNYPVALVRALADAKDNDGRSAVEVAKEAIRNAFIERLFFMGRYRR